MSTLSVGTIQSNTTNPPVFNNSSGVEVGELCRAWVNFNGTGTVAIRASFNVSSITDNGVGDYTVNFTNAMPDANFSVLATNEYLNTRGDAASNHNIYIAAYAASASSANVQTFTSTPSYSDVQTVSIAILR